MPCKFISSFKLTGNFKRHLSAISSNALARTPRNGEEHGEDTCNKPFTSFPVGGLRASLASFGANHANVSHLSVLFCSNVLRISAKMGFLPEGKQVHSHIIKLGYDPRQSLQNQLLGMYLRCKVFADACRLFDEMGERNVVSWNTMISAAVGCGRSFQSTHNLGLLYFKKMLVEMVEPNYITFIGLLRISIEPNDIEIGKQLHCFIIKSNLDLNCFVGSALIDIYSKCSLVEDAQRVFDKILIRDMVLWNVMVSCYAYNRLTKEAFGVFQLMRSEGVNGDDFTFSSLLNSCGVLGTCELGRQVHGLIFRLSFDVDVLVASALVNMYAKNEFIVDARRAFDGMITRNVVSWTTMIVGYGQIGDGREAMKLLKNMIQQGFVPDELTWASILSSCASLPATIEIVQAHAHVVKNGLEAFSSIANALINAYSKCGIITSAFQCFNSIADPDIVTWTSMIGACAFHGLFTEAIEIFEEMMAKGLKLDPIAFLGVLSACSHGGRVEEGLHYFTSMTKDHEIVPDSEHYTCLIDLLGRAGHLSEAFNVLTKMPVEPGSNALAAFIGACKAQGNLELAKWAAERLFHLEPNESVNYTLMSNLYASTGHWVDVARVRKIMRGRCDYKVPGCSWMEISGVVHTFVSCDRSHPQASELYDILGTLFRLMKVEHYMPDVDFLVHPVEDDSVISFLS
ncbi:pentatricopeptide repeat-containing protein At2g46050, mitochondrial-like isoform X1 [Macadamia integrifolia]|uniref:pentatricopeptide repeat-containing protein At2g46050, mitochondrial-like isoform X1 n=2 Tax=Macadamia integrifolia TaxID=60698 RepID=UPI001C4F5563|nr:pentatricopeptide repeat-containing protein At2g46050, mitochondrial-like isoform X1 [Macadamia integrifolia]XP_042491349.1 pentatricopeptide repeat-containing protein At2g46050, mitochondrial-like isoform X1 [Macadamia integrifolia]XP_042491350.1 pentatricopeptide repeat-containing protein At2g46050, mitochondrial-like isoform X1 [Macadamia integrifolia]XP_042491351.1 pentatricopeptide repeat-containing protein At2g46050, mitochondrial-like isoform X1 [Macadamia integrifolia]XP_042491352.1 